MDRTVRALWVIIQQFLNFSKKKRIMFQRVSEMCSMEERDGEEEQRRSHCSSLLSEVRQTHNSTTTQTTKHSQSRDKLHQSAPTVADCGRAVHMCVCEEWERGLEWVAEWKVRTHESV